MRATGEFTRRAASPDEIRTRLAESRDILAGAAAGHDHEHTDLVRLGIHCDLVDHLNDEHGQSLALTGNDGMGTRDLKAAHDRAHELTEQGVAR